MLCTILLLQSIHSQTHTPVYLSQTISGANCKGFYRYLPADYNNSSQNYPLIIWVHGAGQVGQGNSTDLPKILEWGVPKIINEGGWPQSFTVSGINHSFIIISPQFMGWPSGTNVGAMITYISNNYRIDPERIYLMGISAGGGGIWDFASSSIANCDKIAAMIPFCGTLSPTQTLANRIAASALPVWAFHNTYDGTVPVAYSRNWINYINNYNPAPVPAAKLTEFPVQSNNAVIAHECWSLATLPSYKPEGINLYEWMLQYKRRTTFVNANPIARAGTDTSIMLPTTITLNGSGSTDADGLITSYKWKKISGPAGFSLSDSTAAITQLSGLEAGVYQFQLTVTDNLGATGTDNIVINTYAIAPGQEQRVLIDIGPTLTNSPINGIYWNNLTDGRPGIRVSNAKTTLNFPSGIFVQIINRLDGTYSPNSSGTGGGNTTGAVGDYPATATTDIALIHKSGSGLWTIGGLDPAKIYTIKFWGARTNTTALRTAEIKRVDETNWQSYAATNNTNYNNAAVFIISGKSSMDFNFRTKSGSDFSALCVIDIKFADSVITAPPANQAPIALAGSDMDITLPTDSVMLNGCTSTDPENALLTYKWKLIGNSPTAILQDSLSCQTKLNNLLAGSYLLELTVTDTGNLASKDSILITVHPTVNSNWPPIYTATCNSAYKIVVLGSSTAYGSGAVPIDSSWANKLKSYILLQNPQAQLTNLALPGFTSYHVMPSNYTPPSNRPFVPDTTHNITKALLLKPDAIILNLPSNDVALGVPVNEVKNNFDLLKSKADSAGIPMWITTTQPRNNLSPAEKLMQEELKNWIVQQYGTKAVDFWTDIADTNNNIVNFYSANDNVHVNNNGHHVFFTRLVQEFIWDSICYRKNQPPVAIAGNDIEVEGDSTTIHLSADASFNPGGGLLQYQWQIISGPGGSLSNSDSITTIFSASAMGQYRIVLWVTNENNITDTDTLLITLLPPNTPPVAYAGPDSIFNIPPTIFQLNGSAVDVDGTIQQFKWKKISGPSILFSNDSIASPLISDLSSGTYLLELTVTDNRNAIARDSIQLIANYIPIAHAGTDISIVGQSANIQLDGSSSTDAEGALLNYEWRIISGSGGSLTDDNTATPTFLCNTEGSFMIELKVSDPYLAFSLDTINLSVYAANIAPIANAGPDQLIHLPINATTLIGENTYDPDGNIVSYLWRKISGPAVTVSSLQAMNPTLSNLNYGTYIFELTVTDNRDDIAKDTVMLIVNAPPNATAGNDISITLPQNSVTLNASGSTDADGTIVAYQWTQILGNTVTIGNSQSAQINISFAEEGIYQFSITVTDNNGAMDTDTTIVTVYPQPTIITQNIKVNIFGGSNPYNDTQWNNWNVAGSLTSATFKYDDGTTSTINAKITASALISDNGLNYALNNTVCPAPVLRYASANTSYRTLTFYGLNSSKTYDLEFYASRKNTGNKTTFAIGSQMDTIDTDNNLNDKANLLNLTPASNGSIVVTISRIGTWNYISGFILTEKTNTAQSIQARTNAALPAPVNDAEPNNHTGFPLAASISPIPAKDNIRIQIPHSNAGWYRINISNISGQVVMQKLGHKPRGTITETLLINKLKRGTYIVHIAMKNYFYSASIVKE